MRENIDLATLSITQGFRIDGAAASDSSGTSVSSAGDFNGDGVGDIVIGAKDADSNGRIQAGSSYILYGKNTGIEGPIDLATLTNSQGSRIDGAMAGDIFGYSVSAAGDINDDGVDDIVIGAPGADPNSRTDAGSSYVIYGKIGGILGPLDLATLTASQGFRIDGATTLDSLGVSVNSAGDVNGDGIGDIVIGAESADPYGRTDAGSSYVIYGKNGGITGSIDLASLTTSQGFRIDGAVTSGFSGCAVSTAGDVNNDGISDIVIGANRVIYNSLTAAGSTYIIYGKNNGITGPIDLLALTDSQGFVVQGASSNNLSGFSVSSGDVNGDDISDIVIGAPWVSYNNRRRSGSCYVIYGKNGGILGPLNLATLTVSQGFSINGAADSDFLGFSVNALNDINGDSIHDIVISAYAADPNSRDTAGSSYVIYGCKIPIINANRLIIKNGETRYITKLNLATEYQAYLNAQMNFLLSNINNGQFQSQLQPSRTINSIALNDVAKGYISFKHAFNDLSPSYKVKASNAIYTSSDFAAFVQFNSDNKNIDLVTVDTTSVHGLRIDGAVAGDFFGYQVSATGDVNGDGINDMVIGAPYADPIGRTNAGSCYVIYGKNGGLAGPLDLASLVVANQGFRIDGTAAGDYISSSVNVAGDVNGDGLKDIIIGAASASPYGRSYAGSTFIIYGNKNGIKAPIDLASLTASQGIRIDGAIAGDSFGLSVSAGDINGDGISDIVISAPGGSPNGISGAGYTYVIYGNIGGINGPLDLATFTDNQGFRINGAAEFDSIGSSVSSGGDINGDGIHDIVIGAPGADPNGSTRAGSAYLIYGKRGGIIGSIDLATLAISQGIRVDGSGNFGCSVHITDDINGDSLKDILIGADNTSPNGRTEAGSVYVVYGKIGGFTDFIDIDALTIDQGFSIDGATAYDGVGYSQSVGGDINGDNITDILIGVEYADPNSREYAGSSYAIYGKAGGITGPIDLAALTSNQGFRIDGALANDRSGNPLSVGDINGDGVSDILISAYNADPNGLTDAGSIYVLYMNDTPRLTTNFTLREAYNSSDYQIINYNDLHAVDNNLPLGELHFIVNNVQHGQFYDIEISTSSPITHFVQQRITDAKIAFKHDGSESAPSFEITVTDGLADVDPVNANVNFIPVSDAPMLVANQITVFEGQTVILTALNLSATDIDDPAGSLIFTVSQVIYGQFENSNNPGIAITQFTQQQVLDGKIIFKPDGSENAPGYAVSVSDGVNTLPPVNASIIFSRINDAPVLEKCSFTLVEGQRTTITADNLLASDEETKDDIKLLFFVSNVLGGQFEKTSSIGNELNNFSQADIKAGLIQFVHDGSEIRPFFQISVSDEDNRTTPLITAVINFTRVTDAPILVNRQLTVTEGQEVLINVSNISAADADSNDDALTFTVSNVSGGQFELSTSSGIAVTSFTQSQIKNNQVKFVHDGSETPAAFSISVSDGTTSTTPVAGIITYYPVGSIPVLVRNQLVVTEDGTTAITLNNFYAEDSDTSDSQIHFSISELTGGRFELITQKRAVTPINSFTQQQVKDGQIQFTQDGSETVSFKVSVSDGSFTSAASPANVVFTDVNEAPLLINQIPDDTIALGSALSKEITTSNFFRDPEGQSLSYTATQADGKPLPSWMRFTTRNNNQVVELTGQAASVGTSRLSLFATDPGNLTTHADFNVRVLDSKSGNNLTGIVAGSVVGGVVGTGLIAGGIFGVVRYRRNEKFKQRREEINPLANLVRGELNLVDVDNFEADNGLAYVGAINAVKNELMLNNIKVDEMHPSEVKQLSVPLSRAIMANVPSKKTFFGVEINPAEITNHASIIVTTVKNTYLQQGQAANIAQPIASPTSVVPSEEMENYVMNIIKKNTSSIAQLIVKPEQRESNVELIEEGLEMPRLNN